jgi:hypothetical protein
MNLCSLALARMKRRPNRPDRANRRQPLGFRETVGEPSVDGFTAAVAHPGRWPRLSVRLKYEHS